MSDYDVVIVGAGLAGLGLAAGLADRPLKVALIEARALPAQMPPVAGDGVEGYDPRVSALTAASQQWLATLGAWEAIAASRLCSYTDMQVWDAEGTGEIHFSAAEVNADCLGHIVENRLIIAALLGRIREAINIRVLDNTPVAGLDCTDPTPYLKLENGEGLRARLLVAADGANSRVRRWAGFDTRAWDYGQQAIVSTVKTEAGHARTAWQRFLPEGPLAFLPLASEPLAGEDDRYCSIVWSADSDYAEALMALDEADFRAALAAAFEHRLGAIEACSQRFSFPLRQCHAVDYIKPGIALVGDAAHSIHPLAGQGINLGFKDAMVLLEELQRANERGLALGDAAVLARYQRRRKGENLAMMAAMEGFKRLFGARALPLRWLRNTGMRWVDGAGPLKRRLIRQAMGLL